VLSSALVLSSTGVLIKILLDDFALAPLSLALLRVLVVALALGAVLALRRPELLRVQRRHLGLFALYGVVGVGLHQIVWITSVQYNGVSVATVLVYIQPAIVALISWRVLGESLDRVKLIALVLTLSGTVMVARAYEASSVSLNALGLLAGVGTGFSWATYALLGRYMAQRYSAWTALFYAFAFGALFLLPLSFALRAQAPVLPANGWAVLLFLALGPTLGGFALYTLGLSYLTASVTTLLGTLEPVFSIVLAFFLFGEVLNVVQAIGAAMILYSVAMLRPRST
jgi:drug/metabolite transporter (DMT)-like permease